jgi:hypothetical protein
MTFNIKEIYLIIWNSLIQAKNWSIWKWFLLSSIGAASGTLQFGEKFFNLSAERSIKYAIYFIITLYFTRFFLIFIKESLKYYHEVYQNSSYGDAIILLKDCFSEVHYYRKTPGFQEEEFMKSMMLFCNNLKVIFDNITKSNCSVSIKVPVAENRVSEKTVLRNLTRDKTNKKRDTDDYKNTKHSIIGNSAFNNSLNKVVTNKPEKYYLNNNVNKTNNYLNTSKACYENEILPYNSEIVHPITPKKSIDPHNFDCHGFICIDSDKVNAFDNKYAPAILEGVSDGIFDLIFELNNSRDGDSN